MGHGKLRKFAENETFKCLIQPSVNDVMKKDGNGFQILPHPIKGNWNSRMFAKSQPIVLELGCGRGEYTIDLSQRIPSRNYIGADIKGARLWQGAKYATEENLPNVAFLRTRIEFIEAFFAPSEVSEIWLTFSDPQLGNANKRLSSPIFLEKYRKFLSPGGRIHLKTDSRFLYEYTKAVAEANGLRIIAATTDLYNPLLQIQGLDSETVAALTDVHTFYERMFMKQGYKINYICFTLDHEGAFVQPSDFDADYWKSIEGPRKFLQNP
jgi:tRNA (guanine-N7-)-methyltransferase